MSCNSFRRTSTPFDYHALKLCPVIIEEEEDDDDVRPSIRNNTVGACRSDMNLSVHRQHLFRNGPEASTSRSKSAQARSKSLPYNFFSLSACNYDENKKCKKDVDVGIGVYMLVDKLTPGKFFVSINHVYRIVTILQIRCDGTVMRILIEKDYCNVRKLIACREGIFSV